MEANNFVTGGAQASRVNAALKWVVAIDAFDYCAPGPLADLLRSDEEIPAELRPVLADIVGGVRKPNKKAAAKLKVPAAERLLIAAHISVVMGIIDVAKHGQSHDPLHSSDPADLKKNVEVRADRRGVEIIEEVRRTDAFRARPYELAKEHYGISRETVENLLRDLKKKIRDYPNI